MVAPLPDHVIERLRQMHAEGATYDEICEALGIGRTTLKRYLKRLALPARQTPITLSDEDRARLAALYADPALTTDAICATFGFSPATLNRYITQFQLPPRGRGYGKLRVASDEGTCEKVRELFLRTPPLTLAAIADQAQLPLDRVRRIIDDLRLTRTPPRRNRKLTSDEEQTFRQLRREGGPLAAIAARLGISESHAGRLAKRLDATRPSLKRVLTETEKEQLKVLYSDGAPLNAIAEQLHIYKARIHREIAAMGIERRSERRSETVLSPGQTDTLLKLYFNTDTPVRAICEEFALPESSLYRIIDRQGGGRRTAHSGTAHALTPEQQERIRGLYRDPGRTIPEICDVSGVSEDTLYRTLALLREPRRMEPTKTKMHDPEMLAELRRLYLDTTVTTAEIRSRLSLSKKTFHNIVRALDLPLRNPRNRKRRQRSRPLLSSV